MLTLNGCGGSSSGDSSGSDIALTENNTTKEDTDTKIDKSTTITAPTISKFTDTTITI